MAIQLPNPGLGDGKTGDNEYVMWTKVKDNFSNTGHAASRLVGTATGNVMEVGAFGLGKRGGLTSGELIEKGDGIHTYRASSEEVPEAVRTYQPSCIKVSGSAANRFSCLWMPQADSSKVVITQHAPGYSSELWITELYHSRNTTKEDDTGYLVASSPVLKMQHDSFEKVHEAEQLDIEVKNIKTGVYEIAGTTGLRDGDGWNLKPPKDVNGNVLCLCEASEKDGVITLKTYKKKFDFETVSIVADYEQPTDIPEGATVMLRFNDLPEELLDEPIE